MTELNLSAIAGRIAATARNGLEVIRLGGLDTGVEHSPFEVVETSPMYQLRRYIPPDGEKNPGPPILMVHPMMMSANMWDVTPRDGAVGILQASGVDPWVIDFGSPDEIEGGMDRTLSDHIVALSAAIDTVRATTGQDVHLAGYSQGGMFCYQSAAYRRSGGVASILVFGSPVDNQTGLPAGPATTFVSAATDFLADRVFSWFDVPGWLARVGFQLLDPVKSVKGRIDFVRQLHDREALLPREAQRRFLHHDGFIAWSGPAVSELLTEFVGENRMMTGGFSISGRMVTLADIRCPVLAFVGEIDDFGKPPAVRAITRAAPDAEVYEVLLRAGHFGLVVGSKAATITWPTVAAWLRWRSGAGSKPPNISLMCDAEPAPATSDLPLPSRLMLGLVETSGLAVALARDAAATATAARNSVRTLASETLRTLPRLARLSQINDHTRVSLGRIIAEQASRAPDHEFLIFEGRAHTYQAVNNRIDNVVRALLAAGVRHGARIGVAMDNRPSALVGVAALSRLGAVAVMMPPHGHLAEMAGLGAVTALLTDPDTLDSAARQLPGTRILVLGGGATRTLTEPAGADVVDLEKIDPDAVDLPRWYRPDPGSAHDLAFVMFSAADDGAPAPRQITNYRWAMSALGTASAGALTDADTVYCLTPLHQPAGLLVSLGGAVAGGTRIALSRGGGLDHFVDDVRRYGATVISYTWTMLAAVVDDPAFPLRGNHPVRLLVGSGMPAGLWKRAASAFKPATVVEFFATTSGTAILANVTGAKIGAKGTPVPGTSQVELAAYDPEADELLTDERGLVRVAGSDQPGLLLARPSGSADPNAHVLRSVFAAGDRWVSTGYLFRRDGDGDLWLLGSQRGLIRTVRGAVFGDAVTDALSSVAGVGLAATYPVDVPAGTLAVTAMTQRAGARVRSADLDAAVAAMPLGSAPDIVHIVGRLPLNSAYRPDVTDLRVEGVPQASTTAWYFDDGTGRYKRLTAAARTRLAGATSR